MIIIHVKIASSLEHSLLLFCICKYVLGGSLFWKFGPLVTLQITLEREFRALTVVMTALGVRSRKQTDTELKVLSLPTFRTKFLPSRETETRTQQCHSNSICL